MANIVKAGSGHVWKKDPPHRCNTPEERKFDIGDIFVCQCGDKYVLEDAQNYQGGPYWKRCST